MESQKRIHANRHKFSWSVLTCALPTVSVVFLRPWLYDLLQHLAIGCPLRDRTSVIVNTLQVYSGSHGRAIVFCETKKEADVLATSSAMTADVHVLHGDIPQDKREMVLKVRAGIVLVFVFGHRGWPVGQCSFAVSGLTSWSSLPQSFWDAAPELGQFQAMQTDSFAIPFGLQAWFDCALVTV